MTGPKELLLNFNGSMLKYMYDKNNKHVVVHCCTGTYKLNTEGLTPDLKAIHDLVIAAVTNGVIPQCDGKKS